MSAKTPWRTLVVCDGFQEAALVATSIASMEFDARVCDGRGRIVETGASEEPPGPCVVEVPEEQWPDLSEVIDDVLAEQHEFDSRLADRDRSTGRGQRTALVVLTIVIAVLATLRLIDL